MKNEPLAFKNIDEYILQYSDEIQANLRLFRKTIQDAAPEATEKISYQMPTFFLNGNLVHFAVFKNHYGLYPGSSGTDAFKEELAQYECSKGAIRFPLNQPLPLDLITRIVKFRVQENVMKKTKKS